GRQGPEPGRPARRARSGPGPRSWRVLAVRRIDQIDDGHDDRRQHHPNRDPAEGKGHPEDERINLVMDRGTDQYADERNDGQPVNGFHKNSPICWLAIEARLGSIPGVAAQAAREELIDAFATASRRRPTERLR